MGAEEGKREGIERGQGRIEGNKIKKGEGGREGIKKGNEEEQWEGIERGQGRNEENWIKRGGDRRD